MTFSSGVATELKTVSTLKCKSTRLWNDNEFMPSNLHAFVLKILSQKETKKKNKKKKKKKKTVGGTRNDPFGYSNTSNIFCLISKYLLSASQTNINIILQDILYSFG